MFSPEEITLLGLSPKEARLLNSLTSTPENPSTLARKSKLKRTSLYSLLEHLRRRGLVQKKKQGKRWYWQIIPQPQLQEQLFNLAEHHRVNRKTVEKEVGLIASEESQYKIYRGKEKLNSLYAELGQLPKHTRLYGIQPNLSMATALKNTSPGLITQINESIKQKGVVVEAILAEDFLSYYLKALGQKPANAKKILKSFSDRLAVTTYVPKDILNFEAELLFYNQTLLILNWKELSAVVIKNKEIVGIMTALFNLAKLSGNRVDQNLKITNLLEK